MVFYTFLKMSSSSAINYMSTADKRPTLNAYMLFRRLISDIRTIYLVGLYRIDTLIAKILSRIK